MQQRNNKTNVPRIADSTSEKRVRATVPVPVTLWRRFKSIATIRGQNVPVLLEEAIERFVEQETAA